MYQQHLSDTFFRKLGVFQNGTEFVHIIMASAAVAQLDRVLGYEPRGRGFDSCQPHQTTSLRVEIL